jgi:hypothetical protein
VSECWKPIPGYEGLYEASSEGRIRSMRPHPKGSTPALHVLAQQQHRNGYLNVGLRRDGKRSIVGVHRLVAAAFHGAPEPGWEARHRDSVKTNNAASNLRWGTHTDNVHDTVAAGHHYSHGRSKTACDSGHEFTPENTRRYVRDGIERRECRTCRREIGKRARQRAARRDEGNQTWQ